MMMLHEVSPKAETIMRQGLITKEAMVKCLSM